ncbi:ImuA family protein [Gluconacetobacter tumulisoli]|uniref:Damage-inducible protein n=1 Tax=Gluconacetobacter tumulisoli TaxID=1286189 RepID=A0A7W4PJM1_9PROT|nr:damage-inducible protein [Gluconacetobacter tumulisoli]MBB2200482.1 damage-inducible protein [Gluconacetobacter tumulisoli]
MTRTDRTDMLERLRGQIARMERQAAPDAGLGDGPAPWGLAVPEIDRHLRGGLSRGAVHEVIGQGGDMALAVLPARFVAHVLGKGGGPVVWIGTGLFDVHADGLARAGVDPGRLLCVAAGREDVLAVCEDSVRARGVAAVVAELEGALSLTASRRLQLAAEGSGATCFLIRRSRRPDDRTLFQPTASATRWRIAALPSVGAIAGSPGVRGVGAARWSVDLLRCRGGRPGSWIVEAGDAPDRLVMAAVPAGRAAAAAACAVAGPAACHAVA